MDGGETLAIAKVKGIKRHTKRKDFLTVEAVEYHDPSGVFPLIAQQLEGRLPLRNLHWKSPSRPLRSIESLHVELTKGSGDVSGTAGSDRPVSGEVAPLTKERRHQMPGLRETPYLKLYLLRCDDAESYKTIQRKAAREWLKTHTPASQSSSSKKNPQENHDAYEWMILHVVLPNTNAAKEPLNSAVANKSEATDGKDTKSSKFLNRSSGTLLEKLKADFNVPGKHAPDRVAQIRLTYEELQTAQNPSQGLARVSTAMQEQMEAWDDVISKLKSLILASFTLRVSQYEEDIREKDAQRSLPGWNFCTFFVLKEGLARGFERVGLLDDTLAGYEELSADLDNLLASEQAGPMDSFLPHTEELKRLFEKARDSEQAEALAWSHGNRPISSTRKSFRALILANNVSVYDFKVYVLARKMEILNRMSHMVQGAEDLIPLGQMCLLGSAEIPSLSRVVREDLRQILPGPQSDDSETVVDNIVDSWTFAAAQQFLDEAGTSYLAQSSPTQSAFSSLLKEKPSVYPARKSSLTPQSPSDKSDDAQSLFERLKGRLDAGSTVQQKSGKDFLAMQRAQLVLLQRRILETLATKHGHTIGWAEARKRTAEFVKMSDVSLNEEDEDTESECHTQSPSTSNAIVDGIYQQALSQALVSKSHLLRAYEKLTTAALDLFFTAGHGKSFERMLADLAVLKFQQKDYAAASNFFGRVVPIYSHLQWGLIETEMLLMHAKCLKVLNRKDDYVRMLLGLLAKAMSRKFSNQIQTTLDTLDIEEATIDGTAILPELMAYSAQLPYEVTVEMSAYFTNIHIEPHIHHLEGSNGFQVRAKVRSHFGQHISITKAKLLLSSSDGASREIHMENETPFEARPGSNSISLQSSVIVFGVFTVQRFTLVANKISFIKEYSTQHGLLSEMPFSQPLKSHGPKILCYPSADSFEIQLSSSRTIHIDQIRCLRLTCINGPADLQAAEMKLKPLSSGLRLRPADAKLASGEQKLKTSQGSISIPGMKPREKLTIMVPYELDDSHHEISVGIDVTGRSSPLDYSTVQSVVAELPLDVNVHDLFKWDHIFSRFHVRTSSEFPLKVLKIHLGQTDSFTVTEPGEPTMPTVVYPRQPATFMYKIKRSNSSDDTGRQSADREKPLKLVVNYQCVDEIVQSTIISAFVSDLMESEFGNFKRFLMKNLQDRLAAIFHAGNYTDFTMLNEVTVPSFEEVGWFALTSDLPVQAADELCQWLKQWHEKSAVLDFPSPDNDDTFDFRDLSFAPRAIVIAVPLPRVNILHSARLTIESPHSVPVSVGQAVSVKLSLKHARHWDYRSPENSFPIEMEFMYDVDAPADTWLVGGQRRGRFLAREGEVKSWPVLLIPLKTGKLLYPSVDIRPVGKEVEEISSETENSSMGKSVLVVGALRRTTLSVSVNEAFIVSAE